jgi:hypothetical protein
MLVGRVIVENQVELNSFRSLTVYLFQEFQELLVSVARHTVGNDGSFGYIQSSKQGCSSIALVVVCLALGNPWPQWQQWLCPVECLDLALFIHGQNYRVLRGT